MKYFLQFRKSVFFAFMILILSVIDYGGVQSVDITYLDKIEHFGIYIFFTFLFIYDLKNSGIKWRSQKILFFIAVITASAYGGFMEVLQMIPSLHRSAEFLDFFANFAGSAAAAAIFPKVDSFFRPYQINK